MTGRPEPRVIGAGEPEFPMALDQLDPPVERLWVLGKRLDELGPPVAVIGARGPTAYGLDVAHRLGSDLASAGICVVSGMARGIDAAAHEGALAAGGTTVAVLGTGIDRPYPLVNRPLYHRIATEGAVISEQPPGTPGYKSNFRARNRIIAGLSLGTVVVQARGERSGALTTVKVCEQLGRDVLAVPGDVRSELSAGPHQLIREGAALCAGAADILETLAEPLARADPSRFGSSQMRLLAELKQEPVTVDGLAARLGADPIDVARALGRLELSGIAVRELGGYRRA